MSGILQEQRQTSYYPYGVFQLPITGKMGNKKRRISLKYTTHMGHFDEKIMEDHAGKTLGVPLISFPSVSAHVDNKNTAQRP